VYKLPAALALREVHEDDQAFLDALYASRREDLQQMPVDAVFISQMIKMQQHVQMEGVRMNYPEAMHCIIENAGLPVGRIIFTTNDHDLRLIDIAISPRAQRQGIARAVLLAMQLDAKTHCRDIHLAVEQTNFAARGLYMQMGFTTQSANALFEQMRWQHDAHIQQAQDAAQAGMLASISASHTGCADAAV